MIKNIIVRNEIGEVTGMTYPKRAKGLVKHGRAEYVKENEIMLINKEDIVMDEIFDTEKINETPENDTAKQESVSAENGISLKKESPVKDEHRLFFRPREWSFNKTCKDSCVGERCFITSFDETLAEVYCIGNWQYDWTEIVTKDLILEKNTEYAFSFWLNGGENDRMDEVCQLHILFDNDWENRLIFKLNRSFIKPVKHYKGWYLYEIHFTTEDNSYTQLRFVAQRAPMAVMYADAPSAYADLPNEPVPAGKPQRSNLVFENGYPEEPDPFSKGISSFEEKLRSNPVTNGEFFEKIKETVRSEVDRAENARNSDTAKNLKNLGEDIRDSVLSEISRTLRNFK